MADDAIHRLLDLLSDHPTVVVSGTKIAAEIGVPRSTLRGWVLRLRELGVELSGVPATGYRLVRLPDILTPRTIRRAAQGTRFGQRVYHHFKIGSTMDEAARLAAAGDPHGTLVLAEEQTAGRGRMGRTWKSERAVGIYLSAVLRPALPAAAAPLLTLACGLAVADAVSAVTGKAADIRWPNDVLLDEKKCAGILLEMTAEPERIKYVILGVGVNVNQPALPKSWSKDLSDELRDEATSLSLAAGRTFSRADVLAALLRALDRNLARLEKEGRAAIVSEFERRSSYARGRRVVIDENVFGVTEGLDPAGYLLLRRDDTGQLEPIYTGRVRSLTPNPQHPTPVAGGDHAVSH